MKNVTITPASEADIPELIELLGVLFSIEQDFTPDIDKQRRGLAALLASSAGHIAIARDQASRAVGMGTGQLVISTAEGAPSAWIEDVVVHEDWRGRGLGRALLDAVLAWARSQGAVRAQLLVDLDNAPALAFYDRLGWRPTRLGARRLMLDTQ
ncbi:MAG: GNAT family N-acetyltransferase [Betaproteobacteria bacterium]|nr:GNAT family N-acetyltransferase [Betaproteobacteria bacterium]